MALRVALRLCIALLLATAPVSAAVKKMFVTSATGPGRFSAWPEAAGQAGASGGNQICRTLAEDAGLENANLFRAWISTSVTDAYCRVAGFGGKRDDNCGQASLPEAGPWVRTDGKPFAESLARLTDDGAVLYPAGVDENGARVVASNVFTATGPAGRLEGGDCGLWTALSGSAGIGNTATGVESWTSRSSQSCGEPARLLCFEVGEGDPLPDFDEPGAYAFLTSAQRFGVLSQWPEWTSGASVEAGDSICRNLAEANGVYAWWTFVAWLSDSNENAVDRLPPGVPFKRLDGVRVAADRDALAHADGDLPGLLAPLELTESGEHRYTWAYTGTAADGMSSGVHCHDWTFPQVATATVGRTDETRGTWTEFASNYECSSELALYCFSTVVTVFSDGFELGTASFWSNF